MQRDVFFTRADREFYLEKLRSYADKWELEIASYCLMTNHIHLVVIPGTEQSMERTFKPLHLRYSQRLNQRNSTVGLNWQGRYFSAPLDHNHAFFTYQYVVLNPVRAGLVKRAISYEWSSARAHILGEANPYLSASEETLAFARQSMEQLTEDISPAQNDKFATIARNTAMNIPVGSEDFVRSLESTTGRYLRFRPRGQVKKVEKG